MRKLLIIIGSAVGGIIVAVAAILIYADANLNSIIANNRDRLLARVSQSLGRTVRVESITAKFGWGIVADLSGVEIGEDPAFSTKPFITSSNVYAQVDLIPLLTRQLRITKVVLDHPEITIIRNAEGQLNILTLGRKHSGVAGEGAGRGNEAAAPKGSIEGNAMAEAERKEERNRKRLDALHVANFSIAQGKIIYRDPNNPPVEISAIDFDLTNFSFTSAFPIDLKMTALDASAQNVALSGQVGPLMTAAAIDVNAVPIDLSLSAGPFTLADLRKIKQLQLALPPKLQVSDSFSLAATLKGPLDALQLHAASGLTSNQVSFGDSFIKPAGTVLKVDVDGERDGTKPTIAQAQVTLDTLVLKVTKIAFGGGAFSGRIDSNQFDIGSITKFAPAAAKLNVTGKAWIHTDVSVADGRPTANGVIALKGVTIPKPGAQAGSATAVSNLTGDIKLAGSVADIGPLTFNLGAANATLSAHADPIYPPAVTYNLTADAIRTADFVPTRPANEQLNNLTAAGTASMNAPGINDQNKLTSSAGVLNNVAYKNLSVVTSLEGKRLRVTDLRVDAFNGQIVGSGETQLTQSAPFSTAVAITNIDVQQALASQKSKAAQKVRGLLTGNVQLAGRSGKFDQVKNTLDGNGRILLTQGKLVGINVAATALKKVDKLPGIGKLVPDKIVNNHPELFKNPDTEIESASLTFNLKSRRVTSRDVLVKNVDYTLMGNGWIDLDRNIDMAARILLTRALTREIVAQQPSVVYISNKDDQIDFPMQITGRLPKPIVLPNVQDLAQHAGERALQEQGGKALGKFLDKNGLGGILGGKSGSGSGSNPLNNLKKLF